jgi:hypothetical protein
MTATHLTTPLASPPDASAALSAPEAYLLRYGPGSLSGADALVLGVRELVLRDALRLLAVHTPLVFGIGRRTRWMLVSGRAAADATNPALLALLELHARTPRRRLPRASGAGEAEGVLTDDFVRAARRRFGDGRRYAERHVAPRLQSLGLLTRVGGARAELRYRYTAGGQLADDQLHEQMEAAKRAGRRPRRSDRDEFIVAFLLADHANPGLGLLDRSGFESLRPAFTSLEWSTGGGGGFFDGGGCGGDGGGGGC